jgi:hypothetical protein
MVARCYEKLGVLSPVLRIWIREDMSFFAESESEIFVSDPGLDLDPVPDPVIINYFTF